MNVMQFKSNLIGMSQCVHLKQRYDKANDLCSSIFSGEKYRRFFEDQITTVAETYFTFCNAFVTLMTSTLYAPCDAHIFKRGFEYFIFHSRRRYNFVDDVHFDIHL